jgi:hypothetical protein
LARCSSLSSISGSGTPKRCASKADFFVQLEELEHVAADAAAEAVEKAFIAIDLKRRRLLAVKRTQTFVIGARLFQRYVVLDHDDDVGLLLEIVDESLRKKGHLRKHAFYHEGRGATATKHTTSKNFIVVFVIAGWPSW